MKLEEVIKEYASIPDISDFKNPLFIGPHPDDIEFGCGALVSKMKEKGATIHFLVVTDGAAGSADPTMNPKLLANIRKEESITSAKFLNVDTIDFEDLEDGGTFTSEDVLKKVTPYILKYKPDIVFAPDPRLRSECHHDHIEVGTGVMYALQIVGYKEALNRHSIDTSNVTEFPRNIFLAQYFTDDPNKYVEVSEKNLNDKISSLTLHKSQLSSPESELLIKYFMLKAMKEGEAINTKLAESFKVIHPIMQHVYSDSLKL